MEAGYILASAFLPATSLLLVTSITAIYGLKISEEVKSYKGSVSSVDKMGRKKLAYDVQGYRDGFFTTIIVSLPAEAVVDFKRSLKLNENVLRFMFMEEAKKAQTV